MLLPTKNRTSHQSCSGFDLPELYGLNVPDPLNGMGADEGEVSGSVVEVVSVRSVRLVGLQNFGVHPIPEEGFGFRRLLHGPVAEVGVELAPDEIWSDFWSFTHFTELTNHPKIKAATFY